MDLSRRGFLKASLLAAGSALAAYLGPFRAAYRWLKSPSLTPTPTGPLSEQAVSILLATTETVVGYPVEKDHYADFFRWHAENLPGHKALYERFAATVSRASKQSQGCDFAECDNTVRQQILRAAARVSSRGLLAKLGARVLEHDVDRDWELFDSHIVRPILGLFANTDAWRLAGYDAWPGTPRGLERYRRP